MGMPRIGRIGSVLLGIAVTGCTAGTMVATTAPPGYVPDAAARTAAVDWAGAQPVTMTLQEYSYQPATLTLQAGRPYRLHLENAGSRSYTFSAAGFFQAIAAKSLKDARGTTETPYVRDIEVAPRQSVDLQFVAITPGDYPLACHEPLHETLGMTGDIHIR